MTLHPMRFGTTGVPANGIYIFLIQVEIM
ncbi:uncharacterized protein METZ01_LOCUS509248 [marine metagenome]|uniref:Uncharacterized protein n=1 Tax=marine metagenome TaxID=408172 RepID=A0A383EIE9_9ZZZZ